MKDKTPYIIIMAGGVGSRFWPYSRAYHPKQFLDILGTGKTLIRQTFERFLPITEPSHVYVVTNEEYGDLVREQLPELEDHQILREPMRKNTAPCIAYAAYKIAARDPDSAMVVTPADHAIFDDGKFLGAVNTALKAASTDEKLVTIGIKPNRPETGYGYIQFVHGEKGQVRKVKTFTEKPELDMAKKFLESGEFLWNAGIFIWNTRTVIKAIEKDLPEVAEAFEGLHDVYFTEQEQERLPHTYSLCRSISIDYGIMEKSSDVYVVPGNFGWSDLGNWDSLHELHEKDEHDNVVEANAMLYDARNCLVKGPVDKLIVVDGLEGYLVAEHDDVILICKKDNEKKIREYVNDAKNKGDKYL